jgi:DNA-binding NarL/FixJ family response regulator
VVEQIRLLLADDQQLFVENLKIVIESRTEDMSVVGIATDGHKAIELTASSLPDIILMDVRMPGMDGVEATRIIHQRFPSVQIIMLTTFDNDEYVKHALQFGAVGYLLKNIPPEELFASVRAVFNGAVLLSPSIMNHLIGTPQKAVEERVGKAENKIQALELYHRLPDRDREIIRLIALAYSNKDIGDYFSIAEQTVKNHLSLLYDKLGVYRRTELMRMFRDFSREDFASKADSGDEGASRKE